MDKFERDLWTHISYFLRKLREVRSKRSSFRTYILYFLTPSAGSAFGEDKPFGPVRICTLILFREIKSELDASELEKGSVVSLLERLATNLREHTNSPRYKHKSCREF